MSPEVALLLVGASAAAEAPRLEASGYRCSQLEAEAVAGASLEVPPELILVSSDPPDLATLLPLLRRRWPTAPVLLDIVRDSVPARSACLSSGANDFWLSSVPASDLLTRIRLHLALAQEPPRVAAVPSPLRHGDLSLDPSRQQAWRGDRDLELTTRELALLELLLRHRGSVVSREQILAEIWPHSAAGTSNVIEVYVRYLRRKLEAAGERRLIHTVRGRGYCLGDRPPPALNQPLSPPLSPPQSPP